MKNISEWKPTKIQCRGDQFSMNPLGVAPSSLYISLEAFRVLDMHKSYLHGHLVDLGCGNVPYYEWYKDRVDKITCIDWPGSIHSDKYVDIFADLTKPLPLATSSINCVLATDVLEHLCEPQVLFKEIRRILVKDGCLILSVPFLYHVHEEPFDYYRYTPYCLKHLAKEAGLEVISLEYYGSAFGVLVDVTSKTAKSLIDIIIGKFFPKSIGAKIKNLGYKSLRLFQKLCFFLLKQKWILHRLDKFNQLSRKLPLGYIAVFTVPN